MKLGTGAVVLAIAAIAIFAPDSLHQIIEAIGYLLGGFVALIIVIGFLGSL